MSNGRFAGIASGASVIAMLVGFAGLLGWAAEIGVLKSGLPGLVTIKANTAVSFVCAGESLWLQIQRYSTSRRMWIVRACALFPATAGILTLIEYFFGVDLGIDQLLFHDAEGGVFPGRMAPNTALGFALVGTALLALEHTAPALAWLAQALASLVFTLAFVAITGYAFSVKALYDVAGYTSMSMNTAVGLGAISIGVLTARPLSGPIAILALDNPAGAGARRLLPVVLVTPFAVGWVLLKGQRAGLYGTAFGVALMVTMCTIVLAALVLWNARFQNRGVEALLDKEKDLARLAEQFRIAIESAPTGMLMTDLTGTIVMINAQIENLFGYPREELLGQRIEMLVPERFRAQHRDFRAGFSIDAKARPMGKGRDLFGLRKDGSEVPIEIGLNPLETSEGHFVLSSVEDITGRKRAIEDRERLLAQFRILNAELEERVRARTADLNANLKEREVLLQEIHHRVRNNLQVISSLISMQARKLQDASSRGALGECQNRVQAIALIHEKLYQSRDFASVPFSDYARSLASSIFQALGVSQENFTLSVEIENLSLAVDKAIPCGLILNELITNALKHAFPNERRGTIRIEMRKIGEGEFGLLVGDDGVGMSAGFDAATSDSLGIDLVRTLVEQLGGQLEIMREAGTAFRIRFPVEVTK